MDCSAKIQPRLRSTCSPYHYLPFWPRNCCSQGSGPPLPRECPPDTHPAVQICTRPSPGSRARPASLRDGGRNLYSLVPDELLKCNLCTSRRGVGREWGAGAEERKGARLSPRAPSFYLQSCGPVTSGPRPPGSAFNCKGQSLNQRSPALPFARGRKTSGRAGGGGRAGRREGGRPVPARAG